MLAASYKAWSCITVTPTCPHQPPDGMPPSSRARSNSKAEKRESHEVTQVSPVASTFLIFFCLTRLSNHNASLKSMHRAYASSRNTVKMWNPIPHLRIHHTTARPQNITFSIFVVKMDYYTIYHGESFGNACVERRDIKCPERWRA